MKTAGKKKDTTDERHHWWGSCFSVVVSVSAW